MSTIGNGPSPITRFIALGNYDGATDGVLQFGDHGPVYHFALPPDVDEAEAVTAPDRPFDLRPLPVEALDELTAILSPYSSPAWPGWFVPWRFPSAEIEARVDERVTAVLARAGPPVWRLTTPDPWRFSAVRLRPFAAARAG